ncbi:MAG TPA: iron-containing redox enzyme family protein [Pyrinomonadaceae bacterium]
MNDTQSSVATAPARDHSIGLFGTWWQPQEIKPLIDLYAARPLFGNTAEWIIRDNPYRRPVDWETVRQLDFGGALSKSEILGANALAAHRMLLNIYETDLIFLPANDFANKRNDFSSYYSNDNKLLGELIRPSLEAHVFSFLDDEIDVTGKWTVEALKSYLQSIVEKHEQSSLDICARVLASADPQRAARALLIQVAGDFLSEASASARNILGKYGDIQSELFKIVIDDYGYGVHPAKHSTLYENTLASCGLIADVHAYWHFYLSSSLAIGNYYHYVCRDHSKYFRAIGAIAIAESMFSHTCREISRMLRAVFGKAVDTYYFDEHYHIDAHHGRMAFDYVVAPAIARHGNSVIPDIVRGMEELQLLTAINDEDLMAQIAFADAAQPQNVEEILQELGTSHVESRSQSLVTRVCDQDKLYVVDSGSLDLMIGHDHSVQLEAGQSIVVPRGRLHGTAVVSEECHYRTYDALP